MAKIKKEPEVLTGNVKDILKKSEESFTENKMIKHSITLDTVKAALGKGYAGKVSQHVVDQINRLSDDTGLNQDDMDEYVMSNITVVRELGLPLQRYVEAVRYCVLKEAMTNKDAYIAAFPDKYTKYLADKEAFRQANGGKDSTVTIEKIAYRYNQTPAVVRIDSQTAIAFSVLYASQRHRALNVLIKLSQGKSAPSATGEPMTVSPMVQMQAASKIMEELKPADEVKQELKAAVSSGLQAGLAEQLAKSVSLQMKKLEMGMSIEEAQKLHISSEDVITAQIVE